MLNENWKPEFGFIVDWIAQDKNGKIAWMINNCWGGVPNQLLKKSNINELRHGLMEFLWEESSAYKEYFERKNGSFILDCYSSCNHSGSSLVRDELIKLLSDDFAANGTISDVSLAVNKGLFMYCGVEGNYEGEDIIFGYENEVKMGDYYRFLMPTKFGVIEDFPLELREGIAISHNLDFTKDRVINKNINYYFLE